MKTILGSGPKKPTQQKIELGPNQYSSADTPFVNKFLEALKNPDLSQSQKSSLRDQIITDLKTISGKKPGSNIQIEQLSKEIADRKGAQHDPSEAALPLFEALFGTPIVFTSQEFPLNPALKPNNPKQQTCAIINVQTDEQISDIFNEEGSKENNSDIANLIEFGGVKSPAIKHQKYTIPPDLHEITIKTNRTKSTKTGKQIRVTDSINKGQTKLVDEVTIGRSLDTKFNGSTYSAAH